METMRTVMNEKISIIMETVNATTQALLKTMKEDYVKKEVYEEMKILMGPPGIHTPKSENLNMHVLDRKGADKVMPNEWAGPASGKPWVEFDHGIRNWALALNKDCVKFLAAAVDPDGDIDPGENVCMQEFNSYLYSVLIKVTTLEPKVYVMNAGLGNGLKAWRELSTWYDPSGGEDRPAALEGITSPPITRATTNTEASKNLQEFEVLLRGFEQRFGVLDGDTKMVGLKKVLPLTLIQSNLRGKKFKDYKEMRRVVVDYINDRSADFNAKDGSSINAVEPHAQCIHNHQQDQGKGGAAEQEALIAAVANRIKGALGKKGAKGDGKGGKKGDGKEQRGLWKGYGGQGGGGKGYGNSSGGGRINPDIICFNCGEKGHPKRLCPKAKSPIQELIDEMNREEPQHEYDDEEEKGDLCLITDNPDDICEVDGAGEKGGTDQWTLMKKVPGKRKVKKVPQQDFVFSIECPGSEDKWHKIEAPVDTAAVDSVMPRTWFPQVRLQESPKSVAGTGYTVADGRTIPNFGQKRIAFSDKAGGKSGITFQVTDVRRALVSARRLREKGNNVILDEKPRIINKATGKVIPLTVKDGMFLLDIWVRESETGPVFGRPV